MTAITIRPSVFLACHASRHAPTARERRAATAQLIGIAEADTDEGTTAQRVTAAFAADYLRERLGVRLLWDDTAGRFIRESCPPYPLTGTGVVVRLIAPRA
jgi:hypothetical protein